MVGEVDTNEMVSELRLFFDTKNNHQMDRNLENNNSLRKRNTKDVITNQKGTRMVKIGQD